MSEPRAIKACNGCFETVPRAEMDGGLCSKCAAEVKVRSCLRCEEEFVSQGRANRLCPRCALANQRIPVTRYGVMGKEIVVEGVKPR